MLGNFVDDDIEASFITFTMFGVLKSVTSLPDVQIQAADEEIWIGRDQGCEVWIKDNMTISKQHCKLILHSKKSGFSLEVTDNRYLPLWVRVELSKIL